MIAVLLSLVVAVEGHGRLTVPVPRNGGLNPANIENAPSSTDASGSSFVCRHGEPFQNQARAQVSAGQKLTLKWSFGAAHVGDCSVYISYDINAALSEMKFFKIANLPDCRSQNNLDVQIDIPDFIPAGNAIMRWDWYALHQHPSVEFYNQCVDISISSAATTSPSQFESYSIISPPIYPSTGNAGVGYRNAFNPSSDQAMTGPACVNGFTGNQCGLTAVGTSRNTGGSPAPPTPSTPTRAPTSTPTHSPTPSVVSPTNSPTEFVQPTPAPTESPAPSPTPSSGSVCLMETDCSVSPWCRQMNHVAYCKENGELNHCPTPHCKWSSGSTTPAPLPAQVCVMETDCSVSQWCTQTSYAEYCQENGKLNHCPTPHCKWSSAAPGGLRRLRRSTPK